MNGIAAHALASPANVAVIDADTGDSLTYAELAGRARATARAWGLQPGSRAALMLPNGLDLPIAQLATAMSQAEFVPINWHLNAEEVRYVVEDSGASLLVTDSSLAKHAPPGIEVRTGVESGVGEPLPGEWALPVPVFYTSGTTGRPKGVVSGLADEETRTFVQQMLADMWGMTSRDTYLLAGPGYHAGPVGWANTTLYVGGTVLTMPSWDAAAAWRLLVDYGVTTAFLTPAHMIRLLEVDDHPTPTELRLVIQAGAPCPVEVKRRFLDAVPGADVSEMYGASEGGATKISREEWLAKPGSVGRPWPGVTIEIRDETGASVPVGTEGVVWIKPPSTQKFTYHNDEQKTASTWEGDSFTVGDIGRLDEDRPGERHGDLERCQHLPARDRDRAAHPSEGRRLRGPGRATRA